MGTILNVVNKVLVAIYAASPAVLTLLVDERVLSIHTAADVGVIITTFAAGWHGSQAVPNFPVKQP